MAAKLDVIIFGATGFTGKYVVKDAVELLKDFKWGIAGRNKERLDNVLKEVGAKVNRNLSEIPIIIADAENEASIKNMAARGKAIINCCGPYDVYGEVVVKACCEAGTHHVDISAEPQYIEKIAMEYNKLAEENGAYVVSTCGFASIPADLGVAYTEQQFDGTVNSIEMFIENTFNRPDKTSRVIAHYGSWESIIGAIRNGFKILAQQRQLRKEKMPALRPNLNFKCLLRRKVDSLKFYHSPLIVTDYFVVNDSQRYFYKHYEKRPIQFRSYLGFQSLILALLFPIFMLFIISLCQWSLTYKMLLKFSSFWSGGLVSHKGPSQENADAQFCAFVFKAKGWSKGTSLSEPPNKILRTRGSGFNPFYNLCSIGMICAVKTMLLESNKMPNTGGVLTPAVAFAKTRMIEELGKSKFGIKFEVIH